jgi:hypothetical protein
MRILVDVFARRLQFALRRYKLRPRRSGADDGRSVNFAPGVRTGEDDSLAPLATRHPRSRKRGVRATDGSNGPAGPLGTLLNAVGDGR